jgi:ATP-dependent exoDNAse (exonuclease V) alpha subunit
LSLKGGFASVAIFHLDVLIVSRKAGRGAVASAAYRAGEKIRDEKTGKTYDYTRKKGVLYREIITPQNSPDWASDRGQLWNAVESCEKRKDSQVAREIMVALPAELDRSQQIKLVRGYILQQFVKKGMVADFVIHAPSKHGDVRNYHVHILLTMRAITPEGFGGKVRKWNAKFYIYQWRQAWEHHVNQALRQAGLDCRIDGRSHASKGLDQEPRLHLGHEATVLERKGEQSERGNENRAIEARNVLRASLCSEYAKTSGEFDDLTHDNWQQSVLQIDEIQCSVSNIQDADQDKVIDNSRIQDGSPSEFFGNQQEDQISSLEERKDALKLDIKAFEARKVELNRQLQNTSDEKTQDRLRLREKLESYFFTKTYNEIFASVLADEDLQKNANEIAALKHEARKAGREYKQYADEWDFHAVRDSDYSPRDQKSADKINKFREREKSQWSFFAVKAEKNGWSPSRIEKERQALKERMDQQLAFDFGLESSLSHAKSMDM